MSFIPDLIFTSSDAYFLLNFERHVFHFIVRLIL